jgi:hypothetical protein
MSDEAVPPPAPLCLDHLMDSALDVLELGRVRILNTVLEQKNIEKAFDDRKFRFAIHQGSKPTLSESNHDAASVFASRHQKIISTIIK